MCRHIPPCPPASAPDHCAAHVLVAHPEQGWSLLCNGVVAFSDYGELLPDGTAVAPPAFRPSPPERAAAMGMSRSALRTGA
jgi:Family of unknown function (DUF5999)